jgi:hypothetical protein
MKVTPKTAKNMKHDFWVTDLTLKQQKQDQIFLHHFEGYLQHPDHEQQSQQQFPSSSPS